MSGCRYSSINWHIREYQLNVHLFSSRAVCKIQCDSYHWHLFSAGTTVTVNLHSVEYCNIHALAKLQSPSISTTFIRIFHTARATSTEPVATQHKHTNMTFLTDIFTHTSQVWKLYSWVNHYTLLTFCWILSQVKAMFLTRLKHYTSGKTHFPTFPIFPDHFQIMRLFQMGGDPEYCKDPC